MFTRGLAPIRLHLESLEEAQRTRLHPRPPPLPAPDFGCADDPQLLCCAFNIHPPFELSPARIADLAALRW